MYTPIQLKAELLSKGISLTENLINNFSVKYLEKRRAYGNPDPVELRHVRIPQELYLDPENLRLIVSINVETDSEWLLDYMDDIYFLINKNTYFKHIVSFPLKPAFYSQLLENKQKLSQIVTLYGGGSLGIFAYGKCHLVEINKPCHYCSISQNRDKGTDFVLTINPDLIYESVILALQDEECPAKQVMLNGGNFKDRDRSFLHYTSLLKSILRAVRDSGKKIDVHLIVYPPENLELLEELKDLDIGLAMNTEVFDIQLFEQYCPGKVETGGRQHIFDALEKAVSVLGKNKVYSILVGGLEPLESLKSGLTYLADMGVSPVINVLHTDPGTPLENFPKPTVEQILLMGKELQTIYSEYGFLPFYEDCGRNSIDSEAYKGLFQLTS
ncbi:radical SAM protein [Pedobacter sp. L105]|uniref:radical SAM protein n=1 Tax=Pedobacter sp. L105 TaxID=1641871 RepID=UPI00131CD9D2|nr:radical SAM protein [Pedobacter sp. L105]